jgi:hypothetical protein
LQAELWWGCGGALLLAVAAGIAEHRRHRRRDLDRVGWVPWLPIFLLALFAAAICAGLAVG